MAPATVFIYALIDPRTEVVKYVGRTDNLARRTKAHKVRPTNREMALWLQELAVAALEPSVKVLERVDATNCDAAEVRWIEAHRDTVLNRHCASLGGAREDAGRKAPEGLGVARSITFKLYQSEIDELRLVCAELGITQADVMRAGIAEGKARMRAIGCGDATQ